MKRDSSAWLNETAMPYICTQMCMLCVKERHNNKHYIPSNPFSQHKTLKPIVSVFLLDFNQLINFNVDIT